MREIPWQASSVMPSVAILDIDSTIMDTTPRNYRILQEAGLAIPEIAEGVKQVHPRELGWNMTDALGKYMTLTDELIIKLQTFWKERFFTDEYVLYDRPYPGVDTFLHWLCQRKISLIYLTGRDEPNMARGTITAFKKAGLPVDRSSQFLFKPSFGMADRAFKEEAVKTIHKEGTVILAVENEPENANMIKRFFPESLVLLIDTVTAPHPEPLMKEIPVFRKYPSREQ